MTELYKLARPKLDGVPVQIIGGKPRGITNRMVLDLLNDFPQFTGEIVVGDPTDPDCHRKTVGWLEQENAFFLFVMWVYDLKTTENYDLQNRLKIVEPMTYACPPYIQYADHTLLETKQAVENYRRLVINQAGYPGIVLREPYGTFGTEDEAITTPAADA